MTNGADDSRSRQTPGDPQSKVLSRAYGDAVEHLIDGPAPSVDDAIRAAAHRAVEGDPRRIEAAEVHAFFRRWRTPLALAATILLAVAIVFRVYRTGEMQIVFSPVPQNTQIAKQRPRGNEPGETPQSNIDKEQRNNKLSGPHPSPASPSQDSSAVNQETTGSAAINRKTVRPPSGATDNAERPRGLESRMPEPPQLGREAEGQQPQAIVRPFPNTLGAAPPDRKQAPVPRAQAPAETTAAPKLDMSRSLLSGESERPKEEKAVDAPLTEVQLLAKRLDARPPEVWVEEVRILKRAGRSAEATELLGALRKKFPSFALPEDLK